MIKIYVGNLPPSATEEDVYRIFGHYGAVHAVALMTRRDSGRNRGFGFVTMEDRAGRKAIASCQDRRLKGRLLLVHEAKAMEESAGDDDGNV